MKSAQPIGFFDSGLGGLSMLAYARHHLPNEHFLYLGDSANAPYGIKSDTEVLELTKSAVAQLVDLGIKALVVACNTATGIAINALRAQYDFPIIGLEPALKYANDTHKDGLILVLATPLTLESAKYAALYEKHGQRARSLPCPGLMDFVENEDLDSQELHHYLNDLFEPYQNIKIDSVVLGCTHYVFLRHAMAQHLPAGTRLLDSNEGVTRQLIRKLDEFNLRSDSTEKGGLSLLSTAGAEKAEQMHRMIKKVQSVLGLS
ncbi:MAG: glutamate racemase [Bacillota bacterium]|nr:glutamate racemase [Bacillota bacterium]